MNVQTFLDQQTLPPQLRQEILALEAKTSAVGAKLVLPDTLDQCRLCIVGEALGADEHLNESYFCGSSGRLLSKLLSDLGVGRSFIHITNVCKIQPPANKLPRLAELGLTIDDFLPLLRAELAAVRPTAILALGNLALHTLTNMEGITKHRGSVLPCTLPDLPSASVYPTLHPAYLLRGQSHLYPYVRHDMQRWSSAGFGLSTGPEDYTYTINPTLTECLDYIHDIIRASSATCFDIETTQASHITCIGLTKSHTDAICIPFRFNGFKNRWTEPEHIILIRALRALWATPGILKIGQNMHYDLHFLQPLLGFPREPLFDTRYAHMLIHADAPHDLGFLTSTYTGMNYHKDDFKDWASSGAPRDETLWSYNIKDVITTHRIALSLMDELRQHSLEDFFYGYTMPFRRLIFQMEMRGLRINLDLLNEWRTFIEDEELPIALDIINKTASCLAGEPTRLNPNSSKQVGTFLADVLKLPVPKTGLQNYTVKEETIEDLRARYPQHKAFLDQLLCTRVLKAKELGTYLSAPLDPTDQRLKCSYGYTNSGRLTSSKNHKHLGTNLQNIPKHLRQIVIPEPNHVFIDADLSAAEARVMAWLMRSDKLKKVFSDGLKIHKVVGSWIYDKPMDELSADEYLTAKKTVHGSNYALGVNKFARIIGMPVSYARQIQTKYREVVPELPAYHEWVQEQITTHKRLETCFGRVRLFTGLPNDDTFRSGYSYLPQSTVVDIINLGLMELWLRLPDRVYITTQTHDSVLISCPPEDTQLVNTLLTECLQDHRTVHIHGDPLTIPLEIEEPKPNWYGK